MLYLNLLSFKKAFFVHNDHDSVHCVYLKQKKQTDS